MCPTHVAEPSTPQPPVDKTEMVEIPMSNGDKPNGVNANGKRGTSRAQRAHIDTQPKNPYAARASDFLSNISNFNIIESTLRGR